MLQELIDDLEGHQFQHLKIIVQSSAKHRVENGRS